MNNISKYWLIIFIIVILFLFGLLIGNIIVSCVSKQEIANTISNTEFNDNLLKINTYMPNNITKIKVSKFDTSSDTPFICYISDEEQIQSFISSFKDTELNEYKLQEDISPLYIIDFYGDSTMTAQISADKILQLSTPNSSEYFKLYTDDFSNIANLTDVKYYLHDSDLEKPSETTCYNAQKILLSGLSDSEIYTLKNEIHNIHSSLEFYLVDCINILKDANSIYWEPATVDEVFTQPDGVKFQSSGFWQYRDSLQNFLELNLNDTTKKMINDILSQLQYGMDNHDLSECFEVHKMLHDLDYWIINYPISSLSIAPADWGGLNCYYGLIEDYNL